tara:strand:+ start:1158 stop:1328 length:171 start_codon:yes stop_codon:yes gene_type:complete
MPPERALRASRNGKALPMEMPSVEIAAAWHITSTPACRAAVKACECADRAGRQKPR